MSDKIALTDRIALTGAAETLLATLYSRALDARSTHPVLADPTAVEVVERLDYDFRRFGLRPVDGIGFAMRARLLDRWTREFLAAHPDATVLHLGCGLDSRVQRIDPGPGVRWFDVDQPQVIELREQLYSARPGYRTIGASVTDPAWLAEVPCARPVLVVAEGLTMYLPASEGPPLLRRLAGQFPGGEMAFDGFSRLGVRLVMRNPVLRCTGAKLDWAIDEPRELEREVPGLRLLTSVSALDMADPTDLAHTARTFRWKLAVLARLPAFRGMSHVARYSFGHS